MKKTVLFRTYRNDNSGFPFDKTVAMGLLPVGNIPNILRTINCIQEIDPTIEFRILVEERLSDYCFVLQNVSVRYYDDLIQAVQGVNHLIVLDGENYFQKDQLVQIISSTANTLFVMDKSEQFKSIHGMGVKVEDDKVKRMMGHGRDHYVDYMLAGAMVLDAQVLNLTGITPLGMQDISTGGMPLQKLYLENVIAQALNKGVEIGYQRFEAMILNIGYPWHLLEANQCEAQIKIEVGYDANQVDETSLVLGDLSMGEGSRIEYHCVVKNNVKIGKNTTIGFGVIIEDNVIIGDNCTISNYAYIAKNSVIGNGVKLGFHSEVGGLIMDHASVVHQSEIYGVVGRFVDIGAGTLVGNLRFDDQAAIINVNGRRLSNKSTSFAFIGDYSRTGIGNIILPGVRIGSYCAIGPGAIVDEDVAHETLVLVNQEKTYKKWSPARYHWK